jgi:signal-transduction protein with cAMP-binding, CBS, and nucleotidyltransferase domain
LGVRGISRDECVQDIMTCPVETMEQSEGIYNATRHMMEIGIRRLPVVDKMGRLVGLVTLDDLLLLVTRELRHLAAGVRAEMRSTAEVSHETEVVIPPKG